MNSCVYFPPLLSIICNELTSVGSERISITCFELSNDHHPKAVSDSESYAELEFCSAN